MEEQGAINMSRALGDHTFKYPLNHKRFTSKATDDFITVEPYIDNITIDPSIHHFMIVASDGVSQQFSDQEAASIIGKTMETRIRCQRNLQTICQLYCK